VRESFVKVHGAEQFERGDPGLSGAAHAPDFALQSFGFSLWRSAHFLPQHGAAKIILTQSVRPTTLLRITAHQYAVHALLQGGDR
jgi:hypothetical protein